MKIKRKQFIKWNGYGCFEHQFDNQHHQHYKIITHNRPYLFATIFQSNSNV